MASLAQINEDGSLPNSYSEPKHTPAEQQIIDRFARRYHAHEVKQRLLQELEQQIEAEELEHTN